MQRIGDFLNGFGGGFFGGPMMGGGPPAPPPRAMHREFTLRLKAYPDVFLGKDLSAGDKIILHSSVLDGLMQAVGEDSLPYPTIFKIENRALERISHCGVLEYSASQNSAFLPNWMMENLLLGEGDEVKLTLVELPKVQFVKFQPEHFSFSQIPDPKVTLEFALRQFTCLTEGDRIQLTYNDQRFDLHVTEVRPEPSALDRAAARPAASTSASTSGFVLGSGARTGAAAGAAAGLSSSASVLAGVPPAGCVIDANVEVDFDPPRVEAPKKVFVPLPVGQLTSESVNTGEYKYFHVRIPDDSQGLQLECKATEGDADLYVSTAVDEPTMLNHTWTAGSKARLGNMARLRVPPNDPNFALYYYVGVHGYKAATSFELSATQYDPRAAAAEDEKKVGGAGGYALSGVSAAGVPLAPADPNAKKCDNCQQYISAGAFMMHSAQCARNNWLCPQCKAIVPKRLKDSHAHCAECGQVVDPSDMEKHILLNHRKVKCECGLEFEPSTLAVHKAHECSRRKFPCVFCQLQVSESEKQAHEDFCGARSVECELCSAPVPRRQMEMHRAVQHGINPCLDSQGNRRRPGQLAMGDPARPNPNPALPPMGQDAFQGGMKDDDLAAALAASSAEEDAALQAALQASLSASAFSAPRDSFDDGPMEDDSSWGDDADDDDPVMSQPHPPIKPSPSYPPPQHSQRPVAPAAPAVAADDFQCPYCPNRFLSEEVFLRHIEACALQQPASPPPRVAAAPRPAPVPAPASPAPAMRSEEMVCPFCQQQFTREAQFFTHVETCEFQF